MKIYVFIYYMLLFINCFVLVVVYSYLTHQYNYFPEAWKKEEETIHLSDLDITMLSVI